jgi:hypothetical protein
MRVPAHTVSFVDIRARLRLLRTARAVEAKLAEEVTDADPPSPPPATPRIDPGQAQGPDLGSPAPEAPRGLRPERE